MGIGCKRIVIRPAPFEASAVNNEVRPEPLEASALIAESALQELVMIGQGTQTIGTAVGRRPSHCRILAPAGGGVRAIEYSGTRPTAP